MRKSKERTEQQKNGELRLIIDEFSRAMWKADPAFVARMGHEGEPLISFTLNMRDAWMKYVQFCVETLK